MQLQEWSVKDSVIKDIFNLWQFLEVDFSAIRQNIKCSCFCSKWTETDCSYCMLSFWIGGWACYMLPPVPLVQRVIKIRYDEAWVILITSTWLRQRWYLDLLHFSEEAYNFLPVMAAKTVFTRGREGSSPRFSFSTFSCMGYRTSMDLEKFLHFRRLIPGSNQQKTWSLGGINSWPDKCVDSVWAPIHCINIYCM